MWRRILASSIDQLRIQLAGAVLDEVEAVFGVAAHQAFDEVFYCRAALGFGGEGDFEQAAGGGGEARGFSSIRALRSAARTRRTTVAQAQVTD